MFSSEFLSSDIFSSFLTSSFAFFKAAGRGISSGNNSLADYLSRSRNGFLNAKNNQPRTSNGKPFLEYLDDSKAKVVALKDVPPIPEHETTKYKYQQKLNSDNKPDYYNPNLVPKKEQLADELVFNRLPDDIKRPYCPHCCITMAYSTPCKYYNIPNAVCKKCKIKLSKDRKMWVCTKSAGEHDDYHICTKCGKDLEYDENESKLYFMQKHNLTTSCYLHLLRKDVIKQVSKDPLYQIKLSCTKCKNKYQILEPFIKKDLYAESVVKCHLCPFRIPDDHITYHCFSRNHLNGYDICVSCAFKLAKKPLPNDNKHHPDVTKPVPYDLSMPVLSIPNPSENIQHFDLPMHEEEYIKAEKLVQKDKQAKLDEYRKNLNDNLPKLNNQPTIHPPQDLPTAPTIEIPQQLSKFTQNTQNNPILSVSPNNEPSTQPPNVNTTQNTTQTTAPTLEINPSVEPTKPLTKSPTPPPTPNFPEVINRFKSTNRGPKADKLELDEDDDSKDDEGPTNPVPDLLNIGNDPKIINQISGINNNFDSTNTSTLDSSWNDLNDKHQDELIENIDLNDDIALHNNNRINEENKEEVESKIGGEEDMVNGIKVDTSNHVHMQKIFENRQKSEEFRQITDKKEFSLLQREDPVLSILYRLMTQGLQAHLLPQKIYQDYYNNRYSLYNNVIYFTRQPYVNKPEWRLVVPKVMRNSLLHLAHDSLIHPGVNNMIKFIKSKYYWYKFTEDIQDFVSKCRVCQDCKSKKPIQHVAKFVYWKPTKINEVVAIDFTKPSADKSVDDKNKCLTVVDL